MKSIYFYADQTDLTKMLIYLQSMQIKFISYYGVQLNPNEYHFDWNGELFFVVPETKSQINISKKHLFFDDKVEDHIQLQTPYNPKGELPTLQCGSFHLQIYESNPALLHQFNLIIKYIKGNYTLSDDKHYYVAPSIGNSWLKNELQFPELFKYKELRICLTDQEIENILQIVNSQGFDMIENGKDIRDNSALDYGKESYVICLPAAKMYAGIASRRKYYLPGSECIFLYKRKIKKNFQYIFRLDVRLNIDKYPELNALFDILNISFLSE